MATQIVHQGRAAWKRLKKGRANYDDWVLVGHALIEGRKVAMRNAGCSSPAGRGYSDAFGDWLLHNRLDLKPSQRAKLFVVMGILPEVERRNRRVSTCSGHAQLRNAAAEPAQEILRRLDLEGRNVPSELEDFIDRHFGRDRQLTLRLAPNTSG